MSEKDPDGEPFWHRRICAGCLIHFSAALTLPPSEPSQQFSYFQEDQNRKVFVYKIPTFLLQHWGGLFTAGSICNDLDPLAKISKLWPMSDSIQSLPHKAGKGTRLSEARLPGLDLMPEGRFRIYFKKGFGLLDGTCCMTAGWRMSPLGLRPCLLS